MTLGIPIKINDVIAKVIFRVQHFPTFLIKAILDKDTSAVLQPLNTTKVYLNRCQIIF